ncbi:MAG: hypothetical protein WDN04_03215 [Rhodospirillales bacterium]
MIVRIDPAGARYTAFSLVDWWYRSIDAETTLSSITGAAAHANAEGSFTLVVAARDPGLRNWVETGRSARGACHQPLARPTENASAQRSQRVGDTATAIQPPPQRPRIAAPGLAVRT